MLLIHTLSQHQALFHSYFLDDKHKMCSLSFSCVTLKEPIGHLNSCHEQNFQIQRTEFDSEKQFQEWKSNVENSKCGGYSNTFNDYAKTDVRVWRHYCLCRRPPKNDRQRPRRQIVRRLFLGPDGRPRQKTKGLIRLGIVNQRHDGRRYRPAMTLPCRMAGAGTTGLQSGSDDWSKVWPRRLVASLTEYLKQTIRKICHADIKHFRPE